MVLFSTHAARYHMDEHNFPKAVALICSKHLSTTLPVKLLRTEYSDTISSLKHTVM